MSTPHLTIGRYATSKDTALDAMEQYGLNNGDGGWCEYDGDTLCIHYDAPGGTTRVVYVDRKSSTATVLNEMADDMESVAIEDTDDDIEDVEFLHTTARLLRREAVKYQH